MRRHWNLAALAAPLLLAGCAGAGGDPDRLGRSGYSADVDWALVGAITEDAEQRGYKVVWVNMPQKKKAGTPTPR